MRPKLRCHHKSKAELPQKSKAESPDRRCFETSRRRPKARAERADCCAHTTADKHFCNMCVLCFAFVCNVFFARVVHFGLLHFAFVFTSRISNFIVHFCVSCIFAVSWVVRPPPLGGRGRASTPAPTPSQKTGRNAFAACM